jgi:hypothetical protein
VTCPLDTAGDRCFWHVGGTAGENGDALYLAAMAPSLAPRVRSVLGDQCIVGKSREGSRRIGHWALNLRRAVLSRLLRVYRCCSSHIECSNWPPRRLEATQYKSLSDQVLDQLHSIAQP